MSTTTIANIIQSAIPDRQIIIFYVFILLLIPSVACSIIIFAYFIRMPQLRKQRSNHIILTLLIVLFIEALTDLPIRLYYLYKNSVMIHTAGFCLYWNWNASVLNIIGLHLMALASIERHLFVFHGQFLTRYHLLVSKLPMVFSIIYPLAFYTGVIFGSWWCTNVYDFTALACGAPCYLITSTFFPLFGILTHHVLPVLIVLFANVILIIRVCYRKSQMNQANTWRKNVRMSIQLLSIAFIYLIVWIPQCVFFIMLALGKGEIVALANTLIYQYTGNFTSFTIIFCPFITLAGLPQLYNKIKEDFTRILRIQNRIKPTVDSRKVGTTNQLAQENN